MRRPQPRSIEASIADDRKWIATGAIPGIGVGRTLLSLFIAQNQDRGLQLGTEYDPHPPFDSGTPEKAGRFIEGEVMRVLEPRVEVVHDALSSTPGYIRS